VAANQPQQRARRQLALARRFSPAAVAFILAAALAGCGSNDGGATATASEYGPITITGNTLPPIDDTTVGTNMDPAVGVTIPEISGEDFFGNPASIELDGRPKAILFISHSCGYCQQELPDIAGWVNETGGVEGVDLIAISTSASEFGGNWPPSDWFEREKWTGPVIVDDEEYTAFSAFGGWVIPFWVFTNGDGVVLGRWAGLMGADSAESAMQQSLNM